MDDEELLRIARAQPAEPLTTDRSEAVWSRIQDAVAREGIARGLRPAVAVAGAVVLSVLSSASVYGLMRGDEPAEVRLDLSGVSLRARDARLALEDDESGGVTLAVTEGEVWLQRGEETELALSSGERMELGRILGLKLDDQVVSGPALGTLGAGLSSVEREVEPDPPSARGKDQPCVCEVPRSRPVLVSAPETAEIEAAEPETAVIAVIPSSTAAAPRRVERSAVPERRPGPATSEALEQELALGWEAFRQGTLDTARAHFRKVREKRPDSGLGADAAYLEVLCLRRSGDRREALAVLESVLSARGELPRRDEFLLAKAELLLERGEREAARSILKPLARSPIPRVRRTAEELLSQGGQP